MPPLTPHPAHLTVQIFAVIKPVVSASRVLARIGNIRDLDGFFYLHTNTHAGRQAEVWPSGKALRQRESVL